MFLLAPDGNFLSLGGGAHVAGGAVLGLLLFVAGLAAEPPKDVVGRGDREHVDAVASAISSAGVLAITRGGVVAVGWHGHPAAARGGRGQQQLRWFVVAASTVGIGLVSLVVGETSRVETRPGPRHSRCRCPSSCCLSSSRSRSSATGCYDIDVIINRAVIYGVSTLVVANGYVLLGRRRRWAARQPGPTGFWPSVVATAVVAMAFQPLRRRVVRLADRLAYGPGQRPTTRCPTSAAGVGHSPAPESLLPAVAEAAVGGSVRASVRVKLDVEHGPLTDRHLGR
jgi:hypothetical protein